MLSNYEKKKAQHDRIGTPVITYIVVFKTLNEVAEKMIGKDKEAHFDFYYDVPKEEETKVIENCKGRAIKGVFENQPERYWRLEGYELKFYYPSTLKMGKDYQIEVKKVKHNQSQTKKISFSDIEEL